VSLLYVSPPESLWRKILYLQSQWFIYSFISARVPLKKESSYKMGKKQKFIIHRTSHGWKTYIQWGATWLPKGIINDTAVSTPVPCSPLHDNFHLGLGRPEPH